MKYFFYLTITLLNMFVHSVSQAYVVPTYRDIKPATQVMLERQSFGAPVAASANRIVAATAGATSAAIATLSAFTLQPDVSRNVVITPGGTTTDIESCVIVVNGTNFFNKVISENFTFAVDAVAATTGAKAFKTVTSVVFPANCESGTFGATWSIGVGEKIGLKRCMAIAGDWVWSTVGGVYEATRATVVVNSTAVESNTADFAGTMDGSAVFLGTFIQNFICKP